MTRSIGKNDVEAVKVWLKGGINPNAKDDEGNTALGLALHVRNNEILTVLLRHGADPNMPINSSNQALPLEKAIEIDRLDLIQSLVSYGADPYMPNRHGQSPMDIATRRGLYDVVEILKQYKPKHERTPNDP